MGGGGVKKAQHQPERWAVLTMRELFVAWARAEVTISLAMVTGTWFEGHHINIVVVVVDKGEKARVDNIRLRLVAISTLLSPSQVPSVLFCNPMPLPVRLSRPLSVELPHNANPFEQLGPPTMLPV